MICTTTRTKHTDRTTYRKSLPWQHFFAPQNVGKRNAVFHLQCYTIEHRFQGAEYNSLISAFFVSASRLNQEEKGFYCVTIYPPKRVSTQKQLSKCDIQRLCIFNCLWWIYLHWIIQRWKNLRRKIQRN